MSLKEDSTLLLPATLAKLTTQEAAAVAQLCSLLLLQHGHYLDKAASAAICRLTLAVLLHYAAPVRRAGIKAVEDCLTQKPQLAGEHALHLYLQLNECSHQQCVSVLPALSCIGAGQAGNVLKLLLWLCEQCKACLHTTSTA